MISCSDNIQVTMTIVLDVVVDIMDYLQWQTIVIVRDTSSGNGLKNLFLIKGKRFEWHLHLSHRRHVLQTTGMQLISIYRGRNSRLDKWISFYDKQTRLNRRLCPWERQRSCRLQHDSKFIQSRTGEEGLTFCFFATKIHYNKFYWRFSLKNNSITEI